jgi:hypothetical protein
MPDAGVIVAIVASGVCGTALLYIAIYYIHRYLHRQCVRSLDELLDYFHDRQARERRRNERHERHETNLRHEDYGREKGGRSESSTSKRHGRRDKATDEERRGREKEVRLEPRAKQRDEVPSSLSLESPPPVMRPPPVQPTYRTRPMLAQEEFNPGMAYPGCRPFNNMATQNQGMQNMGMPNMGIQNHMGMPNQMGMPHQMGMPYQMMPMMAPMTAPMMMPMRMPMNSGVAYDPRYQTLGEEGPDQPTVSATEAVTDMVSEVTAATAGTTETRKGPIRVDYFDRVDTINNLPPVVREAIRKKEGERGPAEKKPRPKDDAEEEIRRSYIPTGAPRVAPGFSNPMFPQYQQWEMAPMPQIENENRNRYAPYAKASRFGRNRPLRNADRRRPTPSNAPPACSRDLG